MKGMNIKANLLSVMVYSLILSVQNILTNDTETGSSFRDCVQTNKYFFFKPYRQKREETQVMLVNSLMNSADTNLHVVDNRDFHQKSINTVDPDFPCGSSTNCSVEYNTSLQLECIDGNCECMEDLCWIYSYENTLFVWRLLFICGECGKLGSECKRVHNSTCQYPGYCAEDGFCHCLEGEHNKNICVVEETMTLLRFLLAGLVTFLLLVAVVLLYSIFTSSHHGRRVCCPRTLSHTTSNRTQHRSHRSRNIPKSPSHISQMYAMQDFDESQSEAYSNGRTGTTNGSEVSEDSDSSFSLSINRSEITDLPASTQPTPSSGKLRMVAGPKTDTGICEFLVEENLNGFNVFEREESCEPSSNKNRSDSHELPILSPMDASGMTDYFNQYHESTKL